MKSPRTVGKFATAFAIALTLVFSTMRDARATVPANIEVDAKFGYATKPGMGVTALGVGIGGRAGVELFRRIYVGVGAMSYFGGSDEDGQGGNGHAYQVGGEAGYGFHLGMLTLRPLVGVGEATFFATDVLVGKTPPGTYGGTYSRSLTQTLLYLEPGLTALVTIGVLQFGANVDLLFLPGTKQSAISPTADGPSTWAVSLVTGLQAGARF